MTLSRPDPVQMEQVDPSEVGMSAARLADAEALMQRQFDEGRSPMLVAVVTRHGKVVFTRAIGDQRPGGPPLTIDSVFPVASQTKPMTAAVIMCLVERGLVGLNESVSLTLPELAGENEDVLVHHLLTHTSGWHSEDHEVAGEARLTEAIASIPEGVDPITHLALWVGWDVPRRLPPGESMQYCSFNYDLLGEIVRRITGGTLDAAMREFIFDPIGMTSSAVIVDDELQPRVIERPPGIPFGPDHAGSPISFNNPLWAACDAGGAGVHTSAPDLVRFWKMFLDGGMVGDTRVISRDAVRVMTTNQIPGVPAADLVGMSHREASWGYGFGVSGFEPWNRFGSATAGPHVIRHGGAGGIGGWIDPERGIVASYIEIWTEMDESGAPLSWAGDRFEDVVTAAVID